jgi:hypothetical protein
VGQVQPLVFVGDEFVEAAVLFEQIQVVEARNEQNIADPVFHQVLKTLKAGAVPVLDPEGIQVFFNHDYFTPDVKL